MRAMFNKKKPVESSSDKPVFKQWLDRELHALAGYINNKVANLSNGKITLITATACLLFSMLLGFAVWQSYSTKLILRVQPIRAPSLASVAIKSRENRVYERIKDFHCYLDHLKVTDVEKYDSILQARPSLLDSLRRIEQIINP